MKKLGYIRDVYISTCCFGNFKQASVGKAGNPNREGALDGPGSADRHLADHVGKHVFFCGQDVVVAGGGLRGTPGNRSSLHRQFHPPCPCLLAPPTSPRLLTMKIPSACVPHD